MMSKLKSFPFIYQLALRILNWVGYFDWKFKRNFGKYQLTPRWKDRIALVVQDPNNQHITRMPQAGELTDHVQYMHNGLQICLGSYYDYGNTRLLHENRGVHEPQEEYVFQEVLKHISPGSVMLELGSYWAFYSMWFHHSVEGARCFMVEPDPYKMNFGQLNFALNDMSGTFISALIAGHSKPRASPPTSTVDEIMMNESIGHLAILHSDIQGHEYEMLQGAHHTLTYQKADFVFISTHSNQLHQQCIECLQSYQYQLVAEANLDESYSWDGLIVARSPAASHVPAIDIAKRT